MNKKISILLAALFASGIAHHALAEEMVNSAKSNTNEVPSNDIEVLKRQLSAQQAINQQLRTRIASLEQQLDKDSNGNGNSMRSLDMTAEKPPADIKSDERNTAIDEALVTRGLVLLPTGTFRVTPTLSWVHDGTGRDRRDSYIAGIGFEAGLPWGMAASVRVPYIYRDYDYGSNDGVGDISIALSKRLNNESDYLPSFVARIGYTHDTGKDAFENISIGSGFRSVDATLSAVKRFDPVVVYGSLSYEHSFDEKTTLRFSDGTPYFKGKIKPGDSYGLSAGVSLAATPEISFDAGMSFSFIDKSRFEDESGFVGKSDRQTVGYLTLGSDFLLTRNLSMSLNAGAGVTDDAADFFFTMALPYRF